jgi:poly(A) polymerase
VLLLSRLPVLEAALHAFGPHKGAAALTVSTFDRALVVLNLHLTSDHSDPRRREIELDALARELSSIEGDVLVLGDFNDGSRGPASTLRMVDAWSAVHGAEDATPTFDPTVNPLAAVSSLSGRASRLDRVFVRGVDLRVKEASLLGTQPSADGLFISDHFGVQVSLDLRAQADGVLDVTPTARTALAFVLPEAASSTIQRLRREHDPSFDRWPPHVNLLFGFVPESSFDEALALVASAARELGPFRAVFEGVRAFEHATDATVWLDPAAEDGAPWQRLRRALVKRFPRCSGRAEGFTPHLTLGKVIDPTKVVGAWSASVGRLELEVGELVLLSRRGDGAMEPRAIVELGNGVIRAPQATPIVRTSLRADPSEDVVRRLASALPEGQVHVTGSRRIGCALPDADLDLVVALPGPVDLAEILTRVRTALPEAESMRRVHAVRVPGLELSVHGLEIDLTVVDVGAVPPDQAVRRRIELGDAAAVALSAISDADALRDSLAPCVPLAPRASTPPRSAGSQALGGWFSASAPSTRSSTRSRSSSASSRPGRRGTSDRRSRSIPRRTGRLRTTTRCGS